MEKNVKTKNQRVTECRQKLYDQIQINLPKGTRDKYKQFAEAQKMSMNSFVLKAMDEYIDRHSFTFITMLEVPMPTKEESLPLSSDNTPS